MHAAAAAAAAVAAVGVPLTSAGRLPSAAVRAHDSFTPTRSIALILHMLAHSRSAAEAGIAGHSACGSDALLCCIAHRTASSLSLDRT